MPLTLQMRHPIVAVMTQSLASRITRHPIPFAADRAAEALALLPDLAPELRPLMTGAAGCSPYLQSLLQKETGWIAAALDDPEATFSAIMATLPEVAPDAIGPALRQAKRRVALVIALCDLAGVWPLEQVTGRLTDFADLSVRLAMRAALAPEIRRGRLPGMSDEDLDTLGGWVAFAMGKMGAHELNYSSDIDLICLFDEARYSHDDFLDARATLIKATRRMAATLNDATGEGYVFRTDLRLRPDPAVTPVCLAMESAERYYESLGRTWERAAWIKARAAAGDTAAGDRFLATLRPFVWRKHLDFAAIQDAHDMRLRIREHKGLGGVLALPGHNMKLGRGGIREIEFFTQTRQLIAGGRDPDLRVRGTVAGLGLLAAKGWVPAGVADTLTRHYRAHREVEHRLQMVADAQTHLLPGSADGMARIAAFCGQSLPEFERDVRARLEEVHALTEGFFAGTATTPVRQPLPSDTQFDPDITARWQSYPALRSARGTAIFAQLKPAILARLAKAARPQEAFLAFDGFLLGLPAGVQVFALFAANPTLIDLLVDIVSTAPALSAHLARNAQVLDAVIGGSFFAPWPGMAALQAELSARLAQETDYEKVLDAARRWAKEWHFRIGVHHLRGLIAADEAGRQYADLAEAAVAGIAPRVLAEFAAKHGAPPGRGAVVLGLGSLGARRLNAFSDLDLIAIYDAAGVEVSTGPRPLPARQYYARLTQAMVTAVTAPMAEGRLYAVDMRLRPSGTKGPVATSLVSFRDYQLTEAWTWEHLALTRARVVAGPVALSADVEALRQEVLTRPQDRARVLADVADMRARIAAAKSPDGPWDAKIGPGRMQDIEVLAQTGTLLAGSAERSTRDGLIAGVACGMLTDAQAAHLADTHALCWQVQSVARLLTDRPLDPAVIGEGGCRMLLRETGAATLDALTLRLATKTAAAAAMIDGILGSKA